MLIRFCRYAEEDPTILASHGAPNYLLGFCTGEIPAAVAAIARDTSEVLDLAIEATHIIFRMAREFLRRSVMVDRTNDYWARAVLSMSPDQVQTILDEYHESQVSRSLCKTKEYSLTSHI